MRFVIEVAGDKNQHYLFFHTREKLRGRWDFAKCAYRGGADEAYRALSVVGAIPGQCIALDTDKGEGMVFDPLAETPEGRQLFERIKQIMSLYPAQFGKMFGLQAKQVFKLNDDEAKTWGFYMSHAILSRRAIHVPGSEQLPSPDAIRAEWPGRRLRDPYCEFEQKGTGKEGDDRRLVKYVDDVPRRQASKPAAAAK